jgi:D-glycero-D-manno-heptose 1,7-bisphosphate phosphatase
MTIEQMDASRIRNVFLDRDGVLNRKMPEGAWVTDWGQFQWLPGAVEAMARLRRAGMTVMVVTNQRGVALGLFTLDMLELIHGNMQSSLAKKGAGPVAIYACPHDVGECSCRKPDVGLFEQALHDFPEANASNSVVIGDSQTDIEAGRRMGMKTIFIQGEPDLQKPGTGSAASLADWVAGSLLQAVQVHLGLEG